MMLTTLALKSDVKECIYKIKFSVSASASLKDKGAYNFLIRM